MTQIGMTRRLCHLWLKLVEWIAEHFVCSDFLQAQCIVSRVAELFKEKS